MRLSVTMMARAMACAASVLLPRVRDTDEPWAEEGRVIHEYLYNVADVGPVEALARVPEEHHQVCAQIDLERIPTLDKQRWGHELAFRYNPQTQEAKLIGQGLTRAAAYAQVPDEEIGATLDVGGDDPANDRVCVVDYKTGWGDRQPLERHFQLRSYGTILARACGRSSALLARLRLVRGIPWITYAVMTEDDFQEHAFEMLRTAEQVERLALAGDAELREAPVRGDHCAGCGALPRCPAFVDLAMRASSVSLSLARNDTSAARDELRLPPLTTESAPQYLAAVAHLRAMADWIERGVDRFSAEKPFPLSDGRLYGPHPHRRALIDAGKAEAILAATVLGTEGAAGAITKKVTKTNIRAALSAARKKNSSVRVEKGLAECMGALEAGGAVVQKVTHPVGPYRPGDPSDASSEE